MNSNRNNIILPSCFDLDKIFEDVCGYDLASLNVEGTIICGHFLESPLEERFVRMFNYVPVDDNSTNPYQANWMISENKLYLLYVNGIINGERLFSTDIVPEYPDDDLFHFNSLNESLTFIIEEIENPGYSASIYKVGDTLSFKLCDGRLTNIKVKYRKR